MTKLKYQKDYNNLFKQAIRGNILKLKEFMLLDFDGELIYNHGEKVIDIIYYVDDSVVLSAMKLMTDEEINELYFKIKAGADGKASREINYSKDSIINQLSREHPVIFNRIRALENTQNE